MVGKLNLSESEMIYLSDEPNCILGIDPGISGAIAVLTYKNDNQIDLAEKLIDYFKKHFNWHQGCLRNVDDEVNKLRKEFEKLNKRLKANESKNQ